MAATDGAKAKLLLDILERVNEDPDLVREINARQDLQYPDLHVALLVARGLVLDAEGPPPSSLT